MYSRCCIFSCGTFVKCYTTLRARERQNPRSLQYRIIWYNFSINTNILCGLAIIVTLIIQVCFRNACPYFEHHYNYTLVCKGRIIFVGILLNGWCSWYILWGLESLRSSVAQWYSVRVWLRRFWFKSCWQRTHIFLLDII